MPAERGPEEGPRLVCAATQHVTVDDRNYLHENGHEGCPWALPLIPSGRSMEDWRSHPHNETVPFSFQEPSGRGSTQP